jgi:hypothetical protein
MVKRFGWMGLFGWRRVKYFNQGGLLAQLNSEPMAIDVLCESGPASK